jgi:hypothetical protein
MMRDIARLNFEGKLQATAEVEGEPTRYFTFGNWDALVSYGQAAGPRQGKSRARRARPRRATQGQSVSGGRIRLPRRFPARRHRAAAEIRKDRGGAGQTPSAQIDGKWQHRQFLRVEEGVYENGDLSNSSAF